MSITRKRNYLLALSVLMTLALVLTALPLSAHAEGEVTLSSTSVALDIEANGTKGTTTLSVTGGKCTVHQDAAINWTSDNAGIATVANGVVTAVAAGSTTVHATCATEATHTASATVTVTQKTAACTVTFTPENFTALNQEKTFTASVTPSSLTGGTWEWTVGSGLSIVSGGNTNAATIKSTATTAGSTVTARYTPAAGTNYTVDDDAHTVTVTDNSPSIALTASKTRYTAKDETGTVTAAITNPGTGTWTYTWNTSSSSKLEVASTSASGATGTANLKAKASGTVTITCTATNGTTSISKSTDIVVELPAPYLRLSSDHSTLSLSRTKTALDVDLFNANSDVPNDSRIYWKSSNTNVATVSGDKYLDNGDGDGTVYAKGNGTATISVYTSDSHVIDSIKITVKDYKTIPQTGQDTRLIYVEIAVLAAVLAAAGVLYGRRRKKNEQ